MNGLYGIPDIQQLPDLDEIDYMAGTAIPLQAKAEGGVEQDLLIGEDLLRQVMKAIYDGTADDIDPDLFREVFRILRQAQEEGERKAEEPMSPEFRQRVDYNTAAFSAFKVHRLQGDMARQLTDENGVLKPFEQWSNDVQPIASHHCGTWLRTEYDTAVLRMQQAADWQRFERDSDIMPCLEWMPSTSLHPGADHKIYWHTVLPVDDPFWSRHRPGDRWNCKCWLQNTDKQPTAVPGDDGSPANRPAPGLDNNPGRDGKLFADSHPYIAEAYPGAKEVVEKVMKEEGVRVSDKINAHDDKAELMQMKKQATAELAAIGPVSMVRNNLYTHRLYFGKQQRQCVAAHLFDEDEVEAFRQLPQLLESIKDGKYVPIDMSRPNYRRKIKEGILHYACYEIAFNNDVYLLKCAVKRDKNNHIFVKEFPYSLKKK